MRVRKEPAGGEASPNSGLLARGAGCAAPNRKSRIQKGTSTMGLPLVRWLCWLVEEAAAPSRPHYKFICTYLDLFSKMFI